MAQVPLCEYLYCGSWAAALTVTGTCVVVEVGRLPAGRAQQVQETGRLKPNPTRSSPEGVRASPDE